MTPPRLAILDVVGLTPGLIGERTPHLARFAKAGTLVGVEPAFPAVTCTAQANYLTGTPPAAHGIVGNGWYDRDLAEVQFWKQSNRLVQGPKLWETLRQRRPGFTCAKLFWWYNMYSTADWSITPRPLYPADGRKVFDIHTWPYSIRAEIKRDLGEFPFPAFWGPAAGRDTPQGRADAVSRWIAASARWIEARHRPDLSLVYLPHLDYNLQRHGPYARAASISGASSPSPVSPGRTGGRSSPSGTGTLTPRPALNPAILRDLQEIDAIVGELLKFYADRGVEVVVLSEYGITNVGTPIHLNRRFRERGWLVVKDELGRETLDAGASRVFAVADHQVAHVHVRDAELLPEVREVLDATSGVEEVLDAAGQRERGIAHPRAGELVAVARENAWFTYYFWLDDERAPDYARTVDIHRKPGYDPVELFTDPELAPLALRAKIGWKLLRKKLGFRMLMDLIPLDATLVKGSHGRVPADPADRPLLIAPARFGAPARMTSTEVHGRLMEWLGGA